MAYLNTFDPETTRITLERLEKISADTQPQWGKMNAGQMLAHLNVAYDGAYGKSGKPLSGFARFMMKLFVKKIVVSDLPYKKNNRTAPEYIIEGDRNFEEEKAKLIAYIQKVEKDGVAYFDGKESQSFGKLTVKEWSNVFYKHLDHHFQQFGV